MTKVKSTYTDRPLYDGAVVELTHECVAAHLIPFSLHNRPRME